jgi:RNA polymerase sigma factor (sigma-70 family)
LPPSKVRTLLRTLRRDPECLLSHEQMVTLHYGWKHDIEAQKCFEAMVHHNYGLVKYACKVVHDREDFRDCCQHSVEGLIRAIEKWEPERGLRFSTYAAGWIQQKVHRFRYNHSRLVRIPEHALVTAGRVYRAYAEVTQEIKAKPTQAQIAARAKTTVEKVQISQEIKALQPISLSERISGTDLVLAESAEVGITESAEDEFLAGHGDGVMIEALQGLDDETRQWLVLHLGLDGRAGISYHAIARRYQIPPVLVAERIRGAIAGLKKVYGEYYETP